AFLDHPAGAAALLAGPVDQLPGAAARRARAGADEFAENAARYLADASAPAAARTGANGRIGLGAVAAAVVTGDRDAERDLALRARCHLGQVDLDAGGDVGAAGPPHPSSDAEEVVAEEGGEEIREAAESERARLEAAAAQSGVAEAVVELAALGVGEDLVGLDDLTETVLRVGGVGDVGMELSREPPQGALDVVGACVTCDAQQLVVVTLGRRHGFTVQPSVG